MDIPNELKPPKEMYEMARDMDENYYMKAYKNMTSGEDKIDPEDAIELLAQVVAERVALSIGYGLNSYDLRILKSVAERHIISVVNAG